MAFQEATKLPYPCRVGLGDRAVDLTLKRTWANLTTWEQLKFVLYMIGSTLQGVSESDIEKYANESLR